MKFINRALLVCLIISSLFSDLISVSTSSISIIYIIFSVSYIIKKRSIVVNKYYIIVFINIIIIAITSMLNYTSMNFKYIVYLIMVILISENNDENDIEVIFKAITIISVICSIYIIMVGKNFDTTELDFVNVRNSIIIQKQSYNILMNIIFPYTILKIFQEKNRKYILALVLYAISSLLILQIKTLIITLPIAFFIMILFNRKIKFKVITIFISCLIIAVYILYKFNLISQLTPIIDYIIYGEKSAYIGNKYLDTLILRKDILILCIEIIKSNFLFGIGYGNFYKYTFDKLFYSFSKGIYLNYPSVTENGVLNFCVEGGVLGLLSHILILFNIIIDLKNILRVFKDITLNQKGICLAFFSLIVSNTMQDNLNFTYWFFIALTIGLIKNYNIKKLS